MFSGAGSFVQSTCSARSTSIRHTITRSTATSPDVLVEKFPGFSGLERFAHWMVRRQRSQVVALDLERTVEARAKVLKRHCRRQFHDLFGTEQGTEFFEYGIGDFGRRSCHSLRITKHRLLAPIEMGTALERTQIPQLFVADTGISTYGRVDVDSKRTANHLRRPQRRHGLQTRFDYC
jgi:hypothetical protein